jgi:hypothetical protein
MRINTLSAARGLRTLIHVTKTESSKEPSMKRQPSANSQHYALRGETATHLHGHLANLEGTWLYLGRWRDRHRQTSR